MIKKYIGILIILTVVLSLTAITAYAAEIKGEFNVGDTVTGNIPDGQLDEWHKLFVTRAGYVTLKVAATRARGLWLRIYSSDGSSSIARQLTSRNSFTGYDEGEIVLPLEIGSYLVRAEKYSLSGSNSDDSTTYTITSSQVPIAAEDDIEPNDSGFLANTAKSFISGHLAAARDDGSRDLSDWYELTIPVTVTIDFLFISEGRSGLRVYDELDGKVSLINVNNTTLNNPTQTYNSEFSVDFQPGTYLIEIRHSRNDYSPNTYYPGAYSLSMPGLNLDSSASDAITVTAVLVAEESNANITVGNRLAWNSVTGVDKFDIYRIDSDGSYRRIAANVTSNTFIDLAIDPITRYTYKVCPAGANASDSGSNAVTVTTGAETLPLLPDATGEMGAAKAYILMQIDNPIMDVNGTLVEVDPGRGTAPVLRQDRTVLPIRAVTEAMSGTVDWDANERKATLAANGNTVTMWIGRTDYAVNGETQSMDIAPFIENDRTMLPLRFAAGNLNCRVTWLNESREILIVFNGTAKA